MLLFHPCSRVANLIDLKLSFLRWPSVFLHSFLAVHRSDLSSNFVGDFKLKERVFFG